MAEAVAAERLQSFVQRIERLEEEKAALAAEGRTVRIHETAAVDREGDVCAVAVCHVYMRRLRGKDVEVSGF